MDTCFPLLKLKHHCVRATGERETNQRRGEKGARAREPTASSLRQGDWPERRESTEGLAGASLGRQLALEKWVVSWVPAPPVNQAREKGLKQVSLHSILLFASRALLFRAEGRGKPSSQSSSVVFSLKEVPYPHSSCLRFRSRGFERKDPVPKRQRAEQRARRTRRCRTLRCRFCCPKLALKF